MYTAKKPILHIIIRVQEIKSFLVYEKYWGDEGAGREGKGKHAVYIFV